MNNKLIEILIYLLDHLKDHDLDIESLSDFSDGLVTRGYDEMEVAEAINWFFERLNVHSIKSTEITEQKTESVRVLNEYERMSISSELYGYLLKLKSKSVITSSQMEKILDYFMVVGTHTLCEQDVNEVIANILFDEY